MSAQVELDWTRTDAGQESALDALPARVVTLLQAAFLMTKGTPAFSSDTVWGNMSMATRECVELHPEAVGALFHHYAKAGQIERTGARVRSQRKKARGRMIECWRWRR